MKNFHNGKIHVKKAENPPTLICKRFCNVMDEAERMNRPLARLTLEIMCTHFTPAKAYQEK